MLKKIVFSFLFLAAVQSISCTGNFAPAQEADVYGLYDDFLKLIESLKNVISDAVEGAKDKLTDAYNALVSWSKEIIGVATKQIDAIIGAALGEIRELKQKADELGVDITDCLAENEQAIIDMPAKLLKNLGNCIEVQLLEARNIIEKTLGEIGAVSNIITDLMDDWSECSGIALVCRGKVIAKAGWETAQVPIRVSAQVVKAMELIATIKSDLTICGTVQVAIASKDAAYLVATITKCVAEKITEQ